MHTAFEKVQSYPCCLLKGSKLSTLLSSCRYASVHFHHVVGISINYNLRGENSINVEILNNTPPLTTSPGLMKGRLIDQSRTLEVSNRVQAEEAEAFEGA